MANNAETEIFIEPTLVLSFSDNKWHILYKLDYSLRMYETSCKHFIHYFNSYSIKPGFIGGKNKSINYKDICEECIKTYSNIKKFKQWLIIQKLKYL